MIYTSLTSSAMATSKLQTSLNNVHSQLKLEKMSSLAKDTRNKGLEYWVIKIGLNPNNVKAVEEIIKNGNANIQTLRKQLKLPTNEHPQAQEVGQMEKEKK